MRTETALKRIRELDEAAMAANHQWHVLERIKRQLADDAGISHARLRQSGIWVEGDEEYGQKGSPGRGPVEDAP